VCSGTEIIVLDTVLCAYGGACLNFFLVWQETDIIMYCSMCDGVL
jgi:hypothetical protein